MAHKHVSNKDTFKNEGFLAKLSSTLMAKRPAPVSPKEKVKSSIKWHKTADITERIKTATGTIAIYSDMPEVEVEKVRESVSMIPTLEEAQHQLQVGPEGKENEEPLSQSDIATAVIAKAATKAVRNIAALDSEEVEKAEFLIALEDYAAVDDDNQFRLTKGQKVEVVKDGFPVAKKPRLDLSAEDTPLLDNSIAKHKMAIRPKKRHPDPRFAKVQESSIPKEERILVKDETGRQGRVPSSILAPVPTEEVFVTSLKRSLQQLSPEETVEVKRKLTKEMKEIKTHKMRQSGGLLGPSPEQEAMIKRSATVKELIETEEEFVKDLDYVAQNYYAIFDNVPTPKQIRDQKEKIFGNFEEIAEFHKGVLLEGVKYHADVPHLVGKTFLRLERDFDKHSEYCSKEPFASDFVDNNFEIREFFDAHSEKIGDDKRVTDHLKLPIQRLNDYQLLLKEIIKYSTFLGDDTTDLERAHDLMQTIPQRATDAKFLASIEGFKGNLFKLGRLIRHDWFSVSGSDKKKHERYLFLFAARILVTKVKRISDERSVFVLKDIIRLPETRLCHLDSPCNIGLNHIEEEDHPEYPLFLQSKKQETRDAWLQVISEYVVDTASVEDLLFEDELNVVSEEDIEGVTCVSPFVEDTFHDLHEENLDEDEEDFARCNYDVWGDPIPKKQPRSPTSPLKKTVESPEVKEEPEVLETESYFDFWTKSDRDSNFTKQEETKFDVEEVVVDDTEEDTLKEEVHLSPKVEEPVEEADVWAAQEPSLVNIRKSWLREELEDIAEETEHESTCKDSLKAKGPVESYTPKDLGTDILDVDVKDYLKILEDDYNKSKEVLGEGESNPEEGESLENFAEAETKEALDFWSNKVNSPDEEPVFDSSTEDEVLSAILEKDEPDFWDTPKVESRESILEEEKFNLFEESIPVSVVESEVEQIEDINQNLTEGSDSHSTKFFFERDSSPSPIKKLKDISETEVYAEKELGSPQSNLKKETTTVSETNKEVDISSKVESIKEELTKPTEIVFEETDFWKQKDISPVTQELEETLPTTTFFEEEPTEFEKREKLDYLPEKESPEVLKTTAEEVENNFAITVETKDKAETSFLSDSEIVPQSKVVEKPLKEEIFDDTSLVEEENLDFWANRSPSPAKSKTLVLEEQESIEASEYLSATEDIKEVEKVQEDIYETKLEVESAEQIDHSTEYFEKEEIKEIIRTSTPEAKEVDFWGSALENTERELVDVEASKEVFTEELVPVEEKELDFWASTETEDFVKRPTSGSAKSEDLPSYSVASLAEVDIPDNIVSPDILAAGEDKGYCTDSPEHRSELVSPIKSPVEKPEEPISITLKEEREELSRVSQKRSSISEKSLSKKKKGVFDSDKKDKYQETRDLEPDFKSVTHPKDSFLKEKENLDFKPVSSLEVEKEVSIKVESPSAVKEESPSFPNKGKEPTTPAKEKSQGPTVKEKSPSPPVKTKTLVEEKSLSSTVENINLPLKEKSPFIKEESTPIRESTVKEVTPVAEEITAVKEETAPVKEESFYIQKESVTQKLKPETETKELEKETELEFAISESVILRKDEMETPPTPTAGPKPEFTLSLCGQIVEPGEIATFLCEVRHPTPYYVTWLKDSKVLNDKLADRIQQQDDGEIHKLKLMNCKIEDSGTYTAKATDGDGHSATCSAQLLVHEMTEEEREARAAEKKPFFLVKMKPTEVIENSKLSYVIHVKGDPMPNVKFLKDAKPLKEDDRISIHRDENHGKYELLIGHVLKSDAGVYKCVAMNIYDEVDCEAQMNVTEEELALENLHGKGSLLQPGEKAEFKWFRDGKEFDPADRFNVMFKDEEDTLALVFQNVTPDDAGIYTCVASTSCGKISCSAELTVAGAVNRLMKEPEAPKFEEELTDTYVPIAGTAMLDCKVSGYPKPELSWTHDGSDLKIGGRTKMLWEDDENVSLVIKNIAENDKGIYNVTAKNELGYSESCASLIIRCPPKFRKFEKEVCCAIGEPLRYTVEVDGEPVPSMKWLKDGKDIPATEREHITYEKLEGGIFVMSIDYMKQTDCAIYTMTATNDMGERSEQFEILADTAPEITRGLDPETEKKAGNDHTFEVRVSGSPSPTATWFKNGKEILSGDKFRITKDGQFYMLKMRGISRTDRGTYKIVVENKNGKAESEGEFLVRGPPEFTTPLKDACAKEGSKDVKLFVEWDANPRPAAKWFFNDKAIKDDTEGFTVKSTDTTSLLVIKNATPEFVGQYSVKLSNEYGDRSGNAKFRLFEAPQLLEGLKDVEFLEDEKNRFQCKVSGVPVPEIKWTKDAQKWTADEKRTFCKKEGDEVYFIQYEASKTDDSGHYVATISNLEGSVSTEATVIVNTPPHIAGSNFRDGKTFIAMHKFVLEVEVSAVPEAEATWYWNDRELKEDEDSVKFWFDGKSYKMERIGSDPDHTGEYKCVLKNKISEAVETGIVRIIEKEARVRQPLQNVYVKENMDGMIQCQIVGDPIPSVEWFRNGNPVVPSDKIITKEDRENRMHYLTFKNITEKDKSVFSLVGKNEHGQCETSCTMAVYVAPKASELKDIVINYGEDLLLKVHIHAVSPPKMTWIKNGAVLEENERIIYLRDEEKEEYSLQIKSVALEDGATYAFNASNEAGEASGKSTVKIHTEKPSILAELKNSEVCLDHEITFKTECKGLPIPKVTWSINSSVISSSERHAIEEKDGIYKLCIKGIKREDYGLVTVTAHNVIGETCTSGTLSQKKLACELIKGLDSITKAAEGEKVNLEVVIKGSPLPEYVWTRDGDVVESSADIKIKCDRKSYCEATVYLTILQSSAADSGQYRMRFFNEVNEAQTETALTLRPVKGPPKISKVSDNLEITESEPALFKCKITGYPKPDVTWMKDGRIVRPTDVVNTQINAKGEHLLEFKSVSCDDAGTYTVVATNDEGRAEASVQLKINPSPSKPKVLSGLKATKVIHGYPCRLEMQLSGFPKPQVAWMKYGKPLDIDGDHMKEIVTEDGRVMLQVAEASDADPGIYTAIATNDFGEVSSSAEITVLDHERKDGQLDGPPRFTEELKSGSFDEGKTIQLPVSVQGGPVPDMKWYKDDQEVKIGDRIFFTYDGDKTCLEIEPCVSADSGKYKCVVENPHGTTETECDITVRKCFEAPSFMHIFPNMQKFPGLDAKFSVKVDGVPKPELSWYFDERPIAADGTKFVIRKDTDGSTLIVKSCTYSDSGPYKVVAKNREGQAEHHANLLVGDDVDPNYKAEAPTILKAIGDQEIYEGYEAKFKAVVAGRPEPNFEWYKNGVKILPDTRIISERDQDGIIRLTVKHVTKDDIGIYELKIWNQHGGTSCKGKLICECISKDKKRPVGEQYKGFDKIKNGGIPVPLSDRPFISALSDYRCTLSWLPYKPAGPMIPVTYQVEMCECPNGDWSTFRTGIKGSSVDLDNLSPKVDYKFRVRVENKFGISEPSPYVATYRNRLERKPISYEPRVGREDDFKIRTEGPYAPPGFRVEKDRSGKFFAAPRFVKLESDSQYGIRGFSGHIKWIAYGYPTPKIRFFRETNEILFKTGSRFSHTYDANTGDIYMFIDGISDIDCGHYTCVVHNEYGESHQTIGFEMATRPRVIQHLRETFIRADGTGHILCRISGYPPCDVVWYRDWHPIKSSIKFRTQFVEPDMYSLHLTSVGVHDSGLYSMSAVNPAGAVSSSCMVHVEQDDLCYNWFGHGRGLLVGMNTRRGCLEDHYDIGDELGRGTQGVAYHCVERISGRNFVAKSMWGDDEFKQWMHIEFDMMNIVNSCPRILRLYDAYAGPQNMVLVTELCGGGELLKHLTGLRHYTEYDVAYYVRQILEGLDYMHDRWMAHLGLNLGDIMLSHANAMSIKIGDLSLARNIRPKQLLPLYYGMPEYVAPEVVRGEEVSYPADMWSVGIITYILLTGISPFRGANDRETLTNIENGSLKFDESAFTHLSIEAKDFIGKLLQYKADGRLDVKNALAHPWMKFSRLTPDNPYRINTDSIKSYHSLFREWYANASCRRWYRRRKLSTAFTHPSKMVYPPGHVYTPTDSPCREVIRKRDDYVIPKRDYAYELGVIKSESHYQQGPDTYLLQLRDTEFPVRVRNYMNLARARSPALLNRELAHHYERIPIVHERRKFTEIMDEEITDERHKWTLSDSREIYTRSSPGLTSYDLPRRVKKEVPSRYNVRDDLEYYRSKKYEGKAPFIRDKPRLITFVPHADVVVSCCVAGDPQPVVQWISNDVILGETSRVTVATENNVSKLEIKNCTDVDSGIYKVLVRNANGQTSHTFRIVRAEIPMMCDPPQLVNVSGTQIHLNWESPVDDLNAPVQCYHLKMRTTDSDWFTVHEELDVEQHVVENLTANTEYQFAVAAKNVRGWSEFSLPSVFRTGSEDSPAIQVKIEKMQPITDKTREHIDYSKEVSPICLKTGEEADIQMRKYKVTEEIHRGRFSSVQKCLRQDDHRKFVCKILERKDRELETQKEIESVPSLRHERLAIVYEMYELPNVYALVMEPLTGVDILTFLSSRARYNEQHVVKVITQVLDGVSYLHWRGICHLDIQPDNVIVSNPTKLEIKLVDFGACEKVDTFGSHVLPSDGLIEYKAPELLIEHKAYYNSDVWSIGVLTYALLTGQSPFKGCDDAATLENIQYVRFKFETLDKIVSKEATRFFMLVFKRDHSNRPNERECLDHHWFTESDHMVRRRSARKLSIEKLKEYSELYHKERDANKSNSSIFTNFLSSN